MDLVAKAERFANLIEASECVDPAEIVDLLRELAIIVGKLPITADGVRVFPGMELWDSVGMCWADMGECDEPRVAGDETGFGMWSAESYYSSRDAVPNIPVCGACESQPGTLTNDDRSRICEDCAQAMNDMRPD